MGLLDDAIREHLELKRRRGADPQEIERLEHEALGPVRRGPDEGEPVAAEPTAPPAASHGAPEEWEDEFDGDAGEDEWEYEEPEQTQVLPGQESLIPEPHAATPPPAPAEPPAPAPAPAPAPPAHEPEPEPGAQTMEYDVEAAHAAEAEGPGSEEKAEGDDVLEETPEFLQDTPDHDRLWFEQRPPRDFDFDG